MKKSIKKVKKKFGINKKGCNFVAVIKQQTSLTIKLQSNENKHSYRQSKGDY